MAPSFRYLKGECLNCLLAEASLILYLFKPGKEGMKDEEKEQVQPLYHERRVKEGMEEEEKEQVHLIYHERRG
jgi:hypothetical protein